MSSPRKHVMPWDIAAAGPNKRIKLTELRELIVPSSFAKCRGSGTWVRWLKKLDGQLECFRIERSDDKTPLPLELLHPVFGRFKENCEQMQVDKEDYRFVETLRESLSAPHDDYAASTFTPAITNGSISDGSYRFGDTLLLNLTCRLQKGEGGGDPTMENVAYYIKLLPKVVDRQFPCILVDLCGPLLSVYGIVNTGDDGAIWEPLTVGYPIDLAFRVKFIKELTRVCASLKVAIRELTEECEDIQVGRRQRRSAPLLVPNHLNRLQFPYKDTFTVNGSSLSFQYVRVLQRFVFVARLVDGREVVVKFSEGYGVAVHEHCWKAGFAPALIGHESLPSGWSMIVMEKLALAFLYEATANKAKVRSQLVEIKRSLADAALVHGDLRSTNVLWDTVKKRVVVVDFDWSGVDGVATYPPSMNLEIVWPAGAEPGKPLRVAHDAYWLDELCGHSHGCAT